MGFKPTNSRLVDINESILCGLSGSTNHLQRGTININSIAFKYSYFSTVFVISVKYVKGSSPVLASSELIVK